MITALTVMVGFLGLLIATGLFYWLRAKARNAGYPVSIFSNNEDPWPYIKRLINNARGRDKQSFQKVMLVLKVCAGLGVVGFVGGIILAVCNAR